MNDQPSRSGTLEFTVDFPALFKELCSPGNYANLGPGGIMGLQLVMLALKRIALVALARPEEHEEILRALGSLCLIIDDDGDMYDRNRGVLDEKLDCTQVT